MRKPIIIIIAILIIVVLGLAIWWFLSATPSNDTTNSGSTQSPATVSTPETTPTLTIVFTDTGFERENYSVKTGDTILVKNTASIDVEFSSDEHPSHTDNPELNMRVLKPGEQGTVTPRNPGTWGIHDHEHAQFTTTLTVTE